VCESELKFGRSRVILKHVFKVCNKVLNPMTIAELNMAIYLRSKLSSAILRSVEW
jgi:hypothetical protein